MKSSACARCAASRISASVASGPAVGDVFADGGGKEKRVLQDDRDLRAQRFFRDLAHVAAIERDNARGRIVKSRHQTEQRAFARAGSADERDDLVRRNLQIDVRPGPDAASS